MMTTLENQYAPAKLPPEGAVTYEQFLEWLDENTQAEWVEGEIRPMSAVSAQHQDITGFLGALLRLYAEEHASGLVLAAPFQMRLSRIRRGRTPDLMFIAKEHLTQLKPSFLDGGADCVIEIASPDSALRDRGEKYAEYEASGVREYWILDPEAKRADFFVLDVDKRYTRATPDAEGRYQSAVLPGFWIKVAWLWQSFLPPVRQVLKEWADGADA
jgi:Uma2 family endonuclease